MRKLLIGASSPIGYSYHPSVSAETPCPVLESPISYSLLYDEIWFLSRSVAHPDLAAQKFVHFVDEELAPKFPFDKIPREDSEPLPNWDWKEWERTLEHVTGGFHDWRCDFHSRPLELGGLNLEVAAGKRSSLYVDRFLCAEFGFDLAENTPNSLASAELDASLLQTSLSEQLLATKFSTIQSPVGFWHPCLIELREDRYLKHFRKKIGSTEIEDPDEVDDHLSELLNVYREEVAKTMGDRFSALKFVTSTASFIVGLIPGIGTVAGGVQWIDELIKLRKDRQAKAWTAFLASVDACNPSTEHLLSPDTQETK